MKLEFIQKFIGLKPLTHEHLHFDSNSEQEVEVTAFSLLDYISGYLEIKDKLNREIEENYYDCLNKKDQFFLYVKDYRNKLSESLNNDPWIVIDKKDPNADEKCCFNEAEFKEEVKRFFNFNYNGFDSISRLTEDEEVIFLLAIDWVEVGHEPSVYPKVQYGMYCFLKKHFTSQVINQLNHFENKLVQIFNTNDDMNVGNQHPNIFKSEMAFELFEEFSKKALEKNYEFKNRLAILSFIYRQMIGDKLIFETLGPGDYRRFLNDEYEISLDKIKRLDEISDSHLSLYNELKHKLKSSNPK